MAVRVLGVFFAQMLHRLGFAQMLHRFVFADVTQIGFRTDATQISFADVTQIFCVTSALFSV